MIIISVRTLRHLIENTSIKLTITNEIEYVLNNIRAVKTFLYVFKAEFHAYVAILKLNVVLKQQITLCREVIIK